MSKDTLPRTDSVKGKIAYSIEVPGMFSRSVEIPVLASHGWVRELNADFDRSLELYELRNENRTLRAFVKGTDR